ncbi:chemotaxis protein [Solibacillus sp. R5-41]|uniref:methyl-accepting chemotaxis protein n=1 Tax=Solibacillus sp. R5-41 TaxID=2048654 RepID=UPI000C124ECF|nr:methyl-accepting chemotaxis protein [Solibacillus sp. R5-41]ATP42173.1 chemotaxis protein [Solibacillus sp. R5-41]
MNQKLKVIVESIEFYQSTYPEDACILIFDTEKVVGYKRGKTVDLKITLGETVEQHRNTTSVRAMKSGRFLREERSEEAFGFPYIASSVPVYDNGVIVGVVTGVISNSRVSDMRIVANELSGSVQEMSATTEQLALASTDVSKRLVELSKYAEQMNDNIQQINSIVGAVKDIAMHSKILGLNASIEAARSGVHGRGFAVVANEIQKMAQNSTNSANSIAHQLLTITDSIEHINAYTKQIASFTEEYTASMHEMSEGYVSINQIGQKLLSLGEIEH